MTWKRGRSARTRHEAVGDRVFHSLAGIAGASIAVDRRVGILCRRIFQVNEDGLLHGALLNLILSAVKSREFHVLLLKFRHVIKRRLVLQLSEEHTCTGILSFNEANPGCLTAHKAVLERICGMQPD